MTSSTGPTETSLFCPDCDYKLIGLTHDRCPECGNRFDLAVLPIECELQERALSTNVMTVLLLAPPCFLCIAIFAVMVSSRHLFFLGIACVCAILMAPISSIAIASCPPRALVRILKRFIPVLWINVHPIPVALILFATQGLVLSAIGLVGEWALGPIFASHR